MRHEDNELIGAVGNKGDLSDENERYAITCIHSACQIADAEQ